MSFLQPQEVGEDEVTLMEIEPEPRQQHFIDRDPELYCRGPLFHMDMHKERCEKCGTPSAWKVEGMVLCTTHALHRLNEIIIEFANRNTG